MTVSFSNLLGRLPLAASGLIVCLALAPDVSAAVTASDDELPSSLEHFGLDEGLSQLSINALQSDDQGFLWVGTQEGLNRFDGHLFRAYRRELGSDSRQSLLSSSIDSIGFEPRGTRLWLGTNDAGLEVIELATWQHHRLDAKQGLSHNRVTQILIDPQGGAWLGTERGMDRVEADLQRARPLGGDAPVVGLTWMPDGKQPVALDRQCRLWRLGRDAREELPAPRGIDECVGLQSGPEGLWLASASGGLFQLDAQGAVLAHWTPAQLATGGSDLSALIRLHDGRVLVGTTNATVTQLDSAQHAPQRLSFDMPPNSAIIRFYQAPDGTWWIGTYTGGLYRVRPLSAVIRNDEERVSDTHAWPSSSVRSIWRDGERMLIGTDQGLLLRDSSRAAWQLVPGLASQAIRSIAADRDGWWLGTRQGLWRLDRNGTVRRLGGLADEHVNDLLLEGDTLWVATRRGLTRVVDGRVRNDPRWAPLNGHTLTRVYRDSEDTLWIGCNDCGVWRMRSGRPAEPYRPRGSTLYPSVWSLYEHDGVLWVGTFSGGLYRIDLKRDVALRYSDREGLSSNVIYTILPDPQGRLWLSTNNGLSVLDPRTRIVQSLGRRDGLQNQEYNSGRGYRDAHGLLYFGGTQGVDVIDPTRLPLRSPQARAVLTDLRILNAGEDRDGSENQTESDVVYAQRIALDHRDNVFTIGMTAIDFAAPGTARLRYRVDGLQKGWVYPQTAHSDFSVSHLPPDRYTLVVEAAGRDGQFGGARRLQIEVLPPPWRHPLAYAGYVVLGLALLGLALQRVRHTVNRERDMVELLNLTVAERTRQLERANQQLLQSNARLQAATRLDPLTQVANRRELQDWLARECPALLAALDEGSSADALYFFMIDVDNFKRINDDYGHQAGDAALVHCADRLRGLCGERDLLVRWGGEEFLLVTRLPREDVASDLAERLRAAVATQRFALAERELTLTCSIGFAPWPFVAAWPALGDWEQSVGLADRCLYAAKGAGKDAWVGLAPGAAPDRPRLHALLAGGAPEELGDSVRVLCSPGRQPRFAR
ncbi:diguanylate cyclase [Xanthomonas sacchari]|uniref:ligand-binding sensor domain-containing diguanylate cyclase n=1 Tax=Xanthomonas sacchari TaxID=56458 RepID=UPI00225BCE51|nr:ligand-binding sensor domain-containing diguanylate cyclase [Xanthomonas sacchari]UYK85699.1 diguanylate cyclase [Xanthomonas sacchari]